LVFLCLCPEKRKSGKGRVFLHTCFSFFFIMAQKSLVSHGLLITEASRSLSGTPHSVRFLWTSDQHDAETSTTQHTTLTRNRYPCATGDIRNRNPSTRAAADPLLLYPLLFVTQSCSYRSKYIKLNTEILFTLTEKKTTN
jgi:hypothetical protein